MRRVVVVAALAVLAVPAGLARADSRVGGVVRPQGSATLAQPGFTDTLVGSPSTPTSITAMPDGRAIVLEKSGKVRVVQNGVLLAGNALSLSLSPCANGERGLLGFAPDPAFSSNGFVYLYYTHSASAPGGCVNRVSRFTMTGNSISAGSEVVLLDNIGSPAGNHNGGDVAIGNDGYLYVAVGDGGCDPRDDSGCAGSNDAAQDLSLLNGKILRIDRTTGAPAPGNPFSGAGTAVCRTRGNTPTTPATWCREIYAYGLRNPWRFAFDPNTGGTRFYINDVGQNAREEVNLGVVGANYGWPAREGFCANNENSTALNPLCAPPAPGLGYTQPLNDYPHNPSNGGDYITGGAHVPNGAWPSEYDGGYFFADGDPGKLFFKKVGSAMQTFATGMGGVSDIDFVMEPAGWALYYVNASTNEIRKITYGTSPAATSGNLALNLGSPTRVYDSRQLGADSGPLRAGTSRLVNVVAGSGDHVAAIVNLTYVRPLSTGFLSVWQPRTTRPASSNINSQTNLVAANTSVVPIDEGGNILVFTSATANVVVDLLGFFDTTDGTATAGRFNPVEPQRAADTRNSPSPTNLYTRSAVGGDSLINVPILGNYDVPASGVSAVALMVTAIADSGTDPGYVTVYPGGGSVPTSSNVNTGGSGDRRANLVIVPPGADGSVDLRLHVTADVIVDVIGLFTDGTAPDSVVGTYVMIPASRAVDTRTGVGFGRLSAGGTGSLHPSAVPFTAGAITQNIVMVNTGGPGYVTAFPTGLSPMPVVSNGNATAAGQIRSTMSLTVLNTGASGTYFASMATDLVVDVTGYFVAPETF